MPKPKSFIRLDSLHEVELDRYEALRYTVRSGSEGLMMN